MNKTVKFSLEREEKTIYMGRIRVRTLKRASRISFLDQWWVATCALSSADEGLRLSVPEACKRVAF